MSNAKLLGLLTLIQLLLGAIVGLQFYLHGSYAGLGVGIFLVPMAFVLSLMVGIACGLRRPINRVDPPTTLGD